MALQSHVLVEQQARSRLIRDTLYECFFLESLFEASGRRLKNKFNIHTSHWTDVPGKALRSVLETMNVLSDFVDRALCECFTLQSSI